MTDLAIAPGEDLTLHCTAATADGQPVDVTGATGVLPVFDSPSTAYQVLAGSMTVTDAAAGQVVFTLPGTQTSPYLGEIRVLYFEAWLADAAGSRTRLDRGKLTVA